MHMVDVIPTMWLTSVHMLYINVTRLAGLFRKGEMMSPDARPKISIQDQLPGDICLQTPLSSK